MNFLLKIVEGPNKGAEIALVEGVVVTLGKGDDCDIVLADATLPAEPVSIEATQSGVTVGGEPLETLHVKTLGATSFAVGPANAPWGDLVWPKAEAEEGAAADDRREGDADSSGAPRAAASEPPPSDPAGAAEKERRGGCLGCVVVLALLVAVAAVLAFLFRDKAKPHAERLWGWTTNAVAGAGMSRAGSGGDSPSAAAAAHTLSDVIASHGLSTTNRNARMVLVGNFATRAERLVATAEAYAASPGVELDFCDDESLKTAAEDTLALLSEERLRVDAATNRVVVLSGAARQLRRALGALMADVPKMASVDVSGVVVAGVEPGGAVGEAVLERADDRRDETPVPGFSRLTPIAAAAPAPSLPVCGILTTPYPCLVLRSGARVLEGAAIGGSVVMKIEADAVTVTNAAGRFVWRP